MDQDHVEFAVVELQPLGVLEAPGKRGDALSPDLRVQVGEGHVGETAFAEHLPVILSRADHQHLHVPPQCAPGEQLTEGIDIEVGHGSVGTAVRVVCNRDVRRADLASILGASRNRQGRENYCE